MYVNSPSAFYLYRRSLRCVVAAAGLLLAACGGGGGSSGAPAAVAPVVVVARPVVNLALTPASVPAGQPVTITWSATDAATCFASGAWLGARGSSGSMVVTPAAAGTFTYHLTCTGSGGSGSGSGAVVLGVTAVGAPGNVAQVVVDGGPAGVGRIVNLPFVNVTVCRPGTALCATVDHVLVDTGSTGLRIFDAALAALALPPVSGASGKVVGECAQFVSGVLWGSVRTADVKIAGETAASISIQQVADTSLASIPGSCASAGANLSTVAALGAKGILGVGLFKQDCGAACAALAIAGTYYECTATTCTSVAMPLARQVANPVIAFGTNNNGVVLVMPVAPPGGAATLAGALIFGINTQSNNQIGPATIYATNSVGNFTTLYKGSTLTSSFLDSGSNALFFADATIPLCALSPGFYCPAATLALSAVNTSPVNGASGTVSFTLENVDQLDNSVSAASLGGGAGRRFRRNTFDWGAPFFFGRTVFVAIEGADPRSGTGPYWAY